MSIDQMVVDQKAMRRFTISKWFRLPPSYFPNRERALVVTVLFYLVALKIIYAQADILHSSGELFKFLILFSPLLSSLFFIIKDLLT
jgi:hypothetical protein